MAPKEDPDLLSNLARHGKGMRGLAGRGASAGITFGVVIVIFTLGGWWLDGRLGTSPTFLLAGLGVGAVGGFIHLVESVSPGTLFRRRRRGK